MLQCVNFGTKYNVEEKVFMCKLKRCSILLMIYQDLYLPTTMELLSSCLSITNEYSLDVHAVKKTQMSLADLWGGCSGGGTLLFFG